MKALLYLTAIFVGIHAAFPYPKYSAFSDTQGNNVYTEWIPAPEALEEAETLSYHESDSIYKEESDDEYDEETALAEAISMTERIPAGEFFYIEKKCTYELKLNPTPSPAATPQPTPHATPQPTPADPPAPQPRGGAASCDLSYRPPANDYISQKFFDDHICVHHGFPPSDITKFCREFRPEIPLYQVMILTPRELGILRNDIRANQKLYESYRNDFPPQLNPPSRVHFYTTDTYLLFYECEFVNGAWRGYKVSNRYQVFIPRGSAEPYQIYHGCPPSRTRPPSGVGQGPC